jgi:hypothetical protein
MERGCIDGIVDASGDTTKPRISPSHQLKHTGDRRESPFVGETCQCRGGQICVYLDTQSGCRGATPIDRRSCRERPPHRRPQEVPVRRGDVPVSRAVHGCTNVAERTDARERRGQIRVYLDTQISCREATRNDRRSLPGATAAQATAGRPHPQGRCTNVVERTRPREVPVRRGDARERLRPTVIQPKAVCAS